jgi:hypothetical protein
MKRQSYVYIIHCKQLNTIKIGYSDSPFARLSQLQMGNSSELSLLSLFKGGKKEEASLHDIFQFNKVRGEWFSVDDNLIEKLLAYQADMIAEDLGREELDFFDLIDNARGAENNLQEVGEMCRTSIVTLFQALVEMSQYVPKDKLALLMPKIIELYKQTSVTNHDP